MWKYSRRFGYDADLAQEHLSDLVYLRHILGAITQIEECVKGFSYEECERSRLVQDAKLLELKRSKKKEPS